MVACLLAATPPKLAVLQVAGGEGVPQSTAAAITEAVVAEVRKQSRAEVITQREISSILSLENQKAMLGCQTDACMAELGGALGADRLVAGDLAKLGESFLFHLRVVDVKKVRVAVQADRRLRGGTIDDVLDVLPAMVSELFAGAAPAASPAAVAAAVAPPPPSPGVMPPPIAAPPPPVAPAPPAGAARDPWSGRKADRPDLRLRYGRKGALAPVELADVLDDSGGLVLVTASGRLVGRGGQVEWVGPAGRTPLTPLDLGSAGPLVYGELGAYGSRLGTPCDGKLQ
jgi:hypothetical protein